jgi:FHS family L-fucose permease-like MFS transporter
LNDILVPRFKDLFHLTNVLEPLLVRPCFFGAYLVMSLPSGWIVGHIRYKLGIVAALATMGMGLFLFVPASIVISYPLFLFALFIVGSGMRCYRSRSIEALDSARSIQMGETTTCLTSAM